MHNRIVMRIGEALGDAEPVELCAEPEVVIGALDGPVGHAFATLLGDQTKGHSRVLAILNPDVQVRPATLMVSKVTVKDEAYTNILMGTVQAAIANGVLDAVRYGDIAREHVYGLGIIVSVWLDPNILKLERIDHKTLFDVHRAAMSRAIHKALQNEPTIEWLLENQDAIVHENYQLGLDGEL